jgi:hypothetical protein
MPALIDDLLNILDRHPLVLSRQVVNYDVTPAGKSELKIRCRLIKGYQFQVWLHHELGFQDYAFQLFKEHPILRWDNSPHFPGVSSAPHHFHNEAGEVSPSPLSGKPLKDLRRVLIEIEKWLARSGPGST